ncbi:MAG: ABC transporter permease [Clostridia bacterium]
MYGALIAFKDFTPRIGFSDSPWIGMKNFKDFFQSPDFGKVMFNTLNISFTNLLWNFPFPIILALFLNEMKNMKLKRFVQTASYLPHFISLVVICGMVKTFVSSNGIVSLLVSVFTHENVNLLLNPKAFVPIYVISGIWQMIGWDSIIYLAALSAVDVEQYEAADIDGAGRFQKMLHITLPSIQITVVTMLILKVGRVMNLGYEKIILLYNPAIYDVSDVISTYVYRMGFETQNWGYSAAVGLFNSVINLILLFVTNQCSKKLAETSLW